MRGRLTAPAIALLALPLAWPAPALADGPASAGPLIDCVEIPTRAPKNPLVKVWYRVPQGYSPARRGRWRVLVLFGGRNCDGRPEVSGKLGWDSWADLNGVFLVAPTLRDDAYWDPKQWSGRALIDALDAIAARFRVSTKGLLLYGYSAGSQASNLFPAWRPDLCRAYASHACGVFHAPSARMRGVAALVMGAATFGVYRLLTGLIANTILCCFGALLVAVVIYLLLVIILKAITYEDCMLLPKGDKIAKILRIG